MAEQLAQATGLYYRANPGLSDTEHAYSLLAYLYSTCALRQASLLFSIWAAKGWGPPAFSLMLQATPSLLSETLPHDPETPLKYEKLTFVTGISRSAVASLVAQAHGPWLLHLRPRERLSILQAIAGFYYQLGYSRKQAYVLREVYGCVMDLVVCGREENGNSRRSGAATPNAGNMTGGLGIQGLTNGERTPLTPDTARGTLGVRHHESAEGNESILRVLKFVCQVLGIDVEAVKLHTPDSTLASTVDRSSSASVESTQQDDQDLELSIIVQGWSELQVGIIREAIAVAESMAGRSCFCSHENIVLTDTQIILLLRRLRCPL